jgi:hypothetical protein
MIIHPLGSTHQYYKEAKTELTEDFSDLRASLHDSQRESKGGGVGAGEGVLGEASPSHGPSAEVSQVKRRLVRHNASNAGGVAEKEKDLHSQLAMARSSTTPHSKLFHVRKGKAEGTLPTEQHAGAQAQGTTSLCIRSPIVAGQSGVV